MTLEMRHPPDPASFARMTTAEMREAFLLENLFVPRKIASYYSHVDRAIIGAVVPGDETITLPASRELAAEYFTQRRELGVFNVGGTGIIFAGGREYCLAAKEALYIGRGNRDVGFRSEDREHPAQFYFVSYPAHAVHPCAKAGVKETESTELGSTASANRRVIRKLIHPAGIKSCQLTMGYTELAAGSVWNTMPAHTHLRRSEIYLYFDLPAPGIVIHCMGKPGETRHLVIRDRQAVVSPPWSVHFAAGTSNYSFLWAMGGENQEFLDMDVVPMESLA